MAHPQDEHAVGVEIDALLSASRSKLLFPCFPLKSGEKHAALNGWQTTATTDPNKLRDLLGWAAFAGRPTTELGIATGTKLEGTPGLLIVLDFDYRHGGDAVWNDLCERHGTPLTPTANSPGGLHVYGFACFNARTRTPQQGLEIKGQRALVVAPGGPDRPWLIPPGAVPFADLEAWAPELFAEAEPVPPQSSRGVPAASGGRSTATAPDHSARGWADEWFQRVRQAPEGQRNNTLNLAALRLGRLVKGGWLEEDEVVDGLLTAAEEAGLGTAEATRTVRSGLGAATAYLMHVAQPLPSEGCAQPHNHEAWLASGLIGQRWSADAVRDSITKSLEGKRATSKADAVRMVIHATADAHQGTPFPLAKGYVADHCKLLGQPMNPSHAHRLVRACVDAGLISDVGLSHRYQRGGFKATLYVAQ